jgi:hypothetical protein
MGDVDLVVMVLVIYKRLRRCQHPTYISRHTPCEDEKGILASLRGFTISSIRVVEFSLKVSNTERSDEGETCRYTKNTRTLASYQVTVDNAAAEGKHASRFGEKATTTVTHT